MQPIGTPHRPNGGVPFYHPPKQKAQPQFVQTPRALATRLIGHVRARKTIGIVIPGAMFSSTFAPH